MSHASRLTNIMIGAFMFLFFAHRSSAADDAGQPTVTLPQVEYYDHKQRFSFRLTEAASAAFIKVIDDDPTRRIGQPRSDTMSPEPFGFFTVTNYGPNGHNRTFDYFGSYVMEMPMENRDGGTWELPLFIILETRYIKNMENESNTPLSPQIFHP